MAQGRIPPQNTDAEKAVLGSLLTNEYAYETVSAILTVKDFYKDVHRVIYEALERVIQKNKKADMILLAEELKRKNKLEEVGGISYLAQLSDLSLMSGNLEDHARLVADKSKLRQLIDAGEKIVLNAYNADEDAEDIINDAEHRILAVSGLTKGEQSFQSMMSIVLDHLDEFNDLQNRKGQITGLETGFTDLDRITSGLQKSDLILIAARPSMGKTAFTLNIAENIAIRRKKDKKTVAFFSLEMPKNQLVFRLLASTSEINLKNLKNGDVKDEEWSRLLTVIEYLDDVQLYIDDTPGLTPTEMRSKLRRLKNEKGLDLVIVDYIQLMQGSRNSRNFSENRQQEISEISRSLKLIARELDVPVIALSQLSRGVESRTDRRPILSDLRESGSLEQDADIVIFLYREKYYSQDETMPNITDIIIRKHRNGELGTVQLLFKDEYTRFVNTTSHERPEE